jgi:hypothetical protein
MHGGAVFCKRAVVYYKCGAFPGLTDVEVFTVCSEELRPVILA